MSRSRFAAGQPTLDSLGVHVRCVGDRLQVDVSGRHRLSKPLIRHPPRLSAKRPTKASSELQENLKKR